VTDRKAKELADAFLAECIEGLRSLSFAEISRWPDYPSAPPVDLHVPDGLRHYKFTLMKATLPTGEIRLAIQRYRYGFLGGKMAVPVGFIIAPDGKTRSLTKHDLWLLRTETSFIRTRIKKLTSASR
jgi:hypothetical protein